MSGTNRLLFGWTKSPLFWGGAASVGFYTLISPYANSNIYIQDYFCSHPVEYVTTTMFFFGLAVLALKAIGLFVQSTGSRGDDTLLLGTIPPGGQAIDDSSSLLERLDNLPKRNQGDPLIGRLASVLERIRRCQSAEGIEEELKFLADRDEDRVYESYSLFRVVIWAIPILGFLGTVIGITLAIANLSPEAVEESLPQTIGALSIAFSTTTQALSLSIVLMFAKYLVSRGENQLLSDLADRADDELIGRFQSVSDTPSGQVEAMRRMNEIVLRATEHLLERQTELWRESLASLQKRWGTMTETSGKTLQAAWTAATDEGLSRHLDQLERIERESAQRNERHWDRIQKELSESASSTVALQESVRDQAVILSNVVDATGQIGRLEKTLNRNLNALAGSKNFEQTVVSLAAAINLLTSRIEPPRSSSDSVELNNNKKKKPGQAA
jgi:biopolymer transport protein ExbB/TolQ